jgi:predicted O-methyltransferase YrrM
VQHVFGTIPGWFKFAPAYARAVAEAGDGALFVEVGTFKGRSAAFLGVEILNSGKRIALHCVDYWDAPDEPDLLATFTANLAPLVSKGLSLTLHREASIAAAARFADRSIDFLWLDAGHRYDDVLADLQAWLPKVRDGGVIGGDDYGFLGVSTAVKEILGTDFETGDADNWPWWRHRAKARRRVL